MPEPTTAELMDKIGELDQQIASFDNEFPWKELGDAARQAESVDNYLGSVIEGIGEAGEKIDERIEDFSEAADLLVLGQRGRTGLPHFFLGSTTTALIHRPNCPTAVIPT